MGACVNSGLAHAPDWTPHRIKVVAADGAPGTLSTKASGMVSEPFEDVFADVNIQNGSPSITVEVLFWSELSQRFQSQSPVVQFTALTGPKMLKFNAGGNRFMLNVTGTFTGGVQVDISCAGANPVQSQTA